MEKYKETQKAFHRENLQIMMSCYKCRRIYRLIPEVKHGVITI